MTLAMDLAVRLGEAPMCPDLSAFLKTLDRRSEFVARGKNGGMWKQKVFHETLLRLCKTNGLPIISPHELRHSFVPFLFPRSKITTFKTH